MKTYKYLNSSGHVRSLQPESDIKHILWALIKKHNISMKCHLKKNNSREEKSKNPAAVT